MKTYRIIGVLTFPPPAVPAPIPVIEVVQAADRKTAIASFAVGGREWHHGVVSAELVFQGGACPDCNKRAKKDGEPTLSSSNFLDQKIYCTCCGWCGVDSVILTAREAARLRETPKQMRLL
jgi:hypothetical protein